MWWRRKMNQGCLLKQRQCIAPTVISVLCFGFLFASNVPGFNNAIVSDEGPGSYCLFFLPGNLHCLNQILPIFIDCFHARRSGKNYHICWRIPRRANVVRQLEKLICKTKKNCSFSVISFKKLLSCAEVKFFSTVSSILEEVSDGPRVHYVMSPGQAIVDVTGQILRHFAFAIEFLLAVIVSYNFVCYQYVFIFQYGRALAFMCETSAQRNTLAFYTLMLASKHKTNSNRSSDSFQICLPPLLGAYPFWDLRQNH